MKNQSLISVLMIGCFSVLNIIMYLSIHKFWVGGSSFLPMIGKLGTENKYLFAFVVNMGVIAGAFIGALKSGEFMFKPLRVNNLFKAVLGGILIGIGITLAPGTGTVAFVIGIPMLSVSSLLSMVGIFIGGFITYSLIVKKSKIANK